MSLAWLSVCRQCGGQGIGRVALLGVAERRDADGGVRKHAKAHLQDGVEHVSGLPCHVLSPATCWRSKRSKSRSEKRLQMAWNIMGRATVPGSSTSAVIASPVFTQMGAQLC
jgi:hypothetical protein